MDSCCFQLQKFLFSVKYSVIIGVRKEKRENVKYKSCKIFPWLIEGALIFDLGPDFEGNFNIKIFSQKGTPIFLPWISKELKMLDSIKTSSKLIHFTVTIDHK